MEGNRRKPFWRAFDLGLEDRMDGPKKIWIQIGTFDFDGFNRVKFLLPMSKIAQNNAFSGILTKGNPSTMFELLISSYVCHFINKKIFCPHLFQFINLVPMFVFSLTKRLQQRMRNNLYF